jgi:hypothetical protein
MVSLAIVHRVLLLKVLRMGNWREYSAIFLLSELRQQEEVLGILYLAFHI